MSRPLARPALVALALSLSAVPLAALALRYDAELSGDLPEPVAEAARSASVLLQLQAEEEDELDPAGLLARARADLDRLDRALRSQGYYAGTADILIDGQSVQQTGLIDRLTGLPDDAVVPVDLRLDTGPQYTVDAIEVTGAPAGLTDPAMADDLPLSIGDPARAEAILAFDAALNTRLQAAGYPFAEIDRTATVDHGARTMGLSFSLAAGPPATLGPVEVEGTDRTDPDFIAARANFEGSPTYSPDALNSYRDRLAALDIFRSIRFEEGEALNEQGQLPLTVTVEERPPRTIGFGARYSTTEGASLRAYWRHRNLFGRAERLSFEGEIDRLGQNAAEDYGYHLLTSYEVPYFLGYDQSLIASVTAEREVLDAYEREAVEFAIGLERALTDELDLRTGLQVEEQRIDDGIRADSVRLVGVPIRLSYDDTDDLLNPSEGVRAQLNLTPFSEWLGGDRSFVRLDGTLRAYEDFGTDGDAVLAGRLRLGAITGAALLDIPPNRRFFAGGGGSVRGYPFQSIAPRDIDGSPLGGRSLVEASAELRLRFGDFGVVPFIDAGGAFASEYPDFDEDIRIGAGIGVRYFTSFGPLRLDVAVPFDPFDGDESYAFYVSLGQAF